MNACDLTAPANYKLTYGVSNPGEVVPRADDWRHKPRWDAGTVFHCYAVYWDGRMCPSLYLGNHPGDYVHAERFPEIFNTLLLGLEKI